jgi:hypothetical protein
MKSNTSIRNAEATEAKSRLLHACLPARAAKLPTQQSNPSRKPQ